MNWIRMSAILCAILLSQGFGCSKGSSNYQAPPSYVVSAIKFKIPRIHSGMSEQEVLGTLGLAPFKKYTTLHSLGAQSSGFLSRRYAFPSYGEYALSLTVNPSGIVVRATFNSEKNSVEWKPREQPLAIN